MRLDKFLLLLLLLLFRIQLFNFYLAVCWISSRYVLYVYSNLSILDFLYFVYINVALLNTHTYRIFHIRLQPK